MIHDNCVLQSFYDQSTTFISLLLLHPELISILFLCLVLLVSCHFYKEPPMIDIFEFKNVVFDLDSTLVSIEGIDELARMNGCYEEISALTSAAMSGGADFSRVFTSRLELIRPKRADLHALGELYVKNIHPGAIQLLRKLKQNGNEVFLITGGLNPAVDILARYLSLEKSNVFANTLYFDADEKYSGFDTTSPLWKNGGKAEVIKTLKQKYAGDWAVVGDGITDFEASEHAQCFIHLTKAESFITNSSSTYHKINDLCILL